MNIYRVLVVDDSAFMRKIVSDILSADPRFVVISTANNGAEAIEKTIRLKPDAITMDVEMPIIDGLTAVRTIMEQLPTPIVMLSSLTEKGADITIQALQLGAFDFIPKPSGSISFDLHKVKQLLLEKMLLAVRSTASQNVNPMPTVKKANGGRTNEIARSKDRLTQLVAIGTSTGGPKALQHVLSRLPSTFSAPILIVQHMPPKFTQSLARRLDSTSNIRIVEAEEGTILENGTAYIAPGGRHMELERCGRDSYCLTLHNDEPQSGHRPSVDVLFKSLLPFKELQRHIVLMTGMGNDGAKGMRLLYESGVHSTIVESETTCIVYGMPGSAVKLNCVGHILPLHQIADKLNELVSLTD